MSKHHRGHHQQRELEEDIGDVVDRISNLPDGIILHHILSLLSTKEVVKTCILSKRWKNLWASVPNIDLDDDESWNDEDIGNATSFVEFVERVLLIRDPPILNKLCLSFDVFRDESHTHKWISYAIEHNVQELDLFLHKQHPSVIPWCVFNNTSLVTLKITLDGVELPSHISLPCLKTLHLGCLQFLSDDYLETLFSGCPVLENLFLHDSILNSLESIVISSSTLKSLTIYDFHHSDQLVDVHSNIKVHAPNLTYFEYMGFLFNNVLLNSVSSSLVKACIDIFPTFMSEKKIASRAVDLLKRLQYVVSLRLPNCTIQSLIRRTDKIPLHFPVFPNLIHLVLTAKIKSCTFKSLMDMLHFCPILQSISLSQGFKEWMDLGEKDRIWLSIPICVSNCLKTVTFKNFRADDSEICFLKRVLKYACVLERMNIWWSENCLRGQKWKTKVRKEVENIERSSTTCVVNFS